VAASPLNPAAAWRASTDRWPLERPGGLPVNWRPLAERIAGTADIRYTTGPATRAALAAAGALGATTRDVIHLPRQPVAADLTVVAHELAHARRAVVRPRFLLADRHAHADDDERAAREVAHAAVTAPAVSRLPVGGAAVMVARAPSGASAGGAAVPPGAGQPSSAVAPGGVLARDVEPPQAGAQTAPAPTGTDGADRAPAAPAVDYERLIGYLESWLVREFERRGGRFGGVF